MKKTILLLIIFLGVCFFVVNTSLAAGEQCAAAGGGSCDKACLSQPQIGYYDCPSGQVCCGNTAKAQNNAINGGGMSQSTQQGTPTGGGSQSSGFGNPIGPNSIEGVLGNIMSYLQGIAGTIAVIFIIIGGIMYMISGGSKEMSERAKKTLIFAIVGLAIVLAAPLFYQEIKAILSGGSPGSALQQILMNVLRLLLSIVGFLAIISMVIGAIWMFTAVGDEDKYELGKKMAGYSIFGLAIALSALIIANQVTNLIGG
ncbi:MAG: TrbC/VirB2 family protein [Candidatus Moranbacteria bacterium]|nr:TrbC/VirB2 family protein [Candidatus Moranbacteria bacterium]